MFRERLLSPQLRSWWVGVAITAVAYALATAILVVVSDPERILDVALVYLLLCLCSAAAFGYRVGIASAIAADVLVNFFFIPPLHRLTVQEPENVVALFLFLAVAIVGASMLSLLRRQVVLASARQAETSLLLELSRQTAHAITPRNALAQLSAFIPHALGAKGCAILRFDTAWSVVACTGDASLSREDKALATEALESGEVVRFGRAVRARIPMLARRSNERALTFVPFRGQERGALRIDGLISPPPLVETERLLRAFADEASVAVHRARLAEDARRVEALERADEFKTTILSSVSHDLRSPLTAIKASVGSLRDESVQWSPSDRETFLETIDSQTDRLTSTVTDLLEMSRLEGGAAHARIEPIELEPLLREAFAAAAEPLFGRAVTVNVEDHLWVAVDYTMALHALVNLLQNAGKYSTRDMPVELRATLAHGRAAIAISDHGPGIAPGDLPHIFEKFYRGSTGVSVKGTGLGLAITKAMVELCRGSIRVRSDLTGTVFTVEFPLAERPAS